MKNSRSRSRQTRQTALRRLHHMVYVGNRQRAARDHADMKTNLIIFGVLVALVAAWFATSINEFVVDEMIKRVPLREDFNMGLAAKRQYERRRINDPDVTAVVRDLGNAILHGARLFNSVNGKEEDTAMAFEFAVLNSDEVNAFALPGGFIFVNAGLLIQSTPDEVAGVLAHEIAHVVMRHSQKAVLEQRAFGWLMDAFAYDDHDADDETFGEALGELLTSAAKQLGTLKYSRRQEAEADYQGFQYLLFANMVPTGIESFMRAMVVQDSMSSPGGGSDMPKPQFLSTHPDPEERARKLAVLWDVLTEPRKRKPKSAMSRLKKGAWDLMQNRL